MYARTGQAPADDSRLTELAQVHLARYPNWNPDQKRGALRTALALLDDLPDDRFCAAGLAGPPGTGKSALARLVCDLARDEGSNTIVLSLDDYYLPRAERARLAAVHPLLAQRGTPGTHDWIQLIRDFDRIRAGDTRELRTPVFDKAADDRAAPGAFRRVEGQPSLVIVEGWLIGAPPQAESALDEPVNDLERSQDATGAWRRYTNTRLDEYHGDMLARLDRRWYLEPPGWPRVVEWRWQQACDQDGDRGRLDTREAVEKFLKPFERIAVHMQATCSHWADRIVRIDENHVMSLA